MIRRVQSEGGFAAVIQKGERDAGTILIVLTENGENSRVYERMPQIDGSRIWHCAVRQTTENKEQFSEYLTKRVRQDPDLWILELDIADGERFIGLTTNNS